MPYVPILDFALSGLLSQLFSNMINYVCKMSKIESTVWSVYCQCKM